MCGTSTSVSAALYDHCWEVMVCSHLIILYEQICIEVMCQRSHQHGRELKKMMDELT